MKKLFATFSIAFILNFIWKNLHSVLYASYEGKKITEFILFRASLFDALVITIFLLPFLYVQYFKKNSWLIIPIGIVVAVFNEYYGLSTNRWTYNALMPLIPFLKIGITPVFQLGVLGYITYLVILYRYEVPA